ncbi:MAG: Gfo/Idh/MocA family oxidoreductase [Clostridiales bacterium]|nr:Gfo/Idh/MocA family oxidoreductase [Clostridiales bacterium]
MFTIGFIDYFLDEWHANNYPDWIREASGGAMAVTHAFGLIDSPLGGLTSAQWCEKYGIKHAATIEEVLAACDGLIVLSPDNPEMHLELCEKPLKSGKPVYVDKTFAPDLKTARAIFDIANAHGTPMYSTSALRYAEEYQGIDVNAISSLRTLGPGSFTNYIVHQLEPLCMLIKAKPVKAMCLTHDNCVTMAAVFADGRHAVLSNVPSAPGFGMDVFMKDSTRHITVASDFFKAFIRELVAFFKDPVPAVDQEETLRVMALRDAGIRALEKPGQWVDVPT